MKHKVIRSGLFVFIVCAFAFIASYGTFTVKKEFDCKKSLYSADCYRTYAGFLEQYL